MSLVETPPFFRISRETLHCPYRQIAKLLLSLFSFYIKAEAKSNFKIEIFVVVSCLLAVFNLKFFLQESSNNSS